MNQEIDYLARYAELRAQISRLEHEAHAVHQKARQQAAHKILTLMQDAGLTLADMEKKPRAPQDKAKRAPWGSKSRGGVSTTAATTP